MLFTHFTLYYFHSLNINVSVCLCLERLKAHEIISGHRDSGATSPLFYAPDVLEVSATFSPITARESFYEEHKKSAVSCSTFSAWPSQVPSGLFKDLW